MTPGDDHHISTFGFYLSQQRCFLLGGPLPAPLNPRDDLDICQESPPAGASDGHSSRRNSQEVTAMFYYAPDRALTTKRHIAGSPASAMTGHGSVWTISW